MTTPANYAFALTRHICDRSESARAKSWRERGKLLEQEAR